MVGLKLGGREGGREIVKSRGGGGGRWEEEKGNARDHTDFPLTRAAIDPCSLQSPVPHAPFSLLMLPSSHQSEREVQLRELRAVLESLWEALRLGKDATAASERDAISALFVGPNRLYSGNIEAVRVQQGGVCVWGRRRGPKRRGGWYRGGWLAYQLPYGMPGMAGLPAGSYPMVCSRGEFIHVPDVIAPAE